MTTKTKAQAQTECLEKANEIARKLIELGFTVDLMADIGTGYVGYSVSGRQSVYVNSEE